MSSIINIEFERNGDKLCYRKRFHSNKCGEDDYFSNIPIDDSNLMLVDDILDIIKNEPHSDERCMDTIPNNMIKMDTKDTYGDTIIDPNDFFNDMYKSEVDYSSTFSSPSYRSTPSPTTSNSSQSSDHLSVDYNSASNQSDGSINMYNSNNHGFSPNTQFVPAIGNQNCHLDTPPISPPTENYIPNATQTIPHIQPIQQLAQPIPVNNQINIIQGTLIPITTVSLPTSSNCSNILSTHHNTSHIKKVKIQPKPLAAIATKPTVVPATVKPIQTNGVPSKTISTPKRIVLSGSDYKSLVLKCKSAATANGTVAATMQPTNDTNLLKFVSAAPTTLPTTNTQPLTVTNNRIQIAPLSSNKKPKQNAGQDEIDERTIKKQMRMIKNRESACLSRKKKKEYVTTLESRLMDLSKENQQLKSQNMALKERLGQMANKICDMCGNLMTEKQSTKSFDTMTVLKSVSKKNAAFLLAFVFMVSLNVGPLISPRASDPFADANSELLMSHHHIGARGLLSIDDDINDSTNTSNVDDGSESDRLYPMCPASVNQTESIRLASELQRWIGDLPENVRRMQKMGNDFELKRRERISSSIKSRLQSANAFEANKRRNSIVPNDIAKHVQIYSPAYSFAMKYATFFEEIHRQDDTFYVVSFRADHLLLPATAHNKTFRPKMSLMLPAWNLNNNNNASTDGIVTLMQIDCEVLNTSMINIKESSIPDNLRNRSSSTSSSNRNTATPDMTKPIKPRKKAKINPNSAQDAMAQAKSNITTGSNQKNINNGFKSTTFDEYDTKKMDTVKAYKPYFLMNRAAQVKNGRN